MATGMTCKVSLIIIKIDKPLVLDSMVIDFFHILIKWIYGWLSFVITSDITVGKRDIWYDKQGVSILQAFAIKTDISYVMIM